VSEHDPARLAAEADAAWRALAPRCDALKTKDRLAIPPQEMPSQAPAERVRNVNEVALGYSEAQARLEATRCLQCKNAPCVAGCPVAIDIPAFVRAIADGDYRTAIETIKRSSLLPAVCGRVCPQEVQCQLPCTVGKALKGVDKAVSIGRLERFVADWERAQGGAGTPAVKPDTGRRVAVIGSGPAGITVAADVRREGHAVTLFEAFHKPGGVMMYGIPEFRLPKRIVDEEIETLRAMGVEIRTNFIVGRTRTLRDLLDRDGYDAVFIGSGAGLPRFMNIEGENLVGVFSANEYLTRANLMRAYDRAHADTPIVAARKVAVLGGGNVAMDAARTAVRLGADEVHLVYRRTEAEMPARVEEVAHAKEEGVVFHLLENAKRILGDETGRVKAMECLRYELGEPDASGRRRPVAIQGSEFLMELDTVIVAIGNDSNPLIRQTTDGLETNRWGNIVADDDGQTSLERVYAGGDIVLGAATVILAMGEGRRAAASINRLLAGDPPVPREAPA
jgi:glutamate synthase (NADPH) small chain